MDGSLRITSRSAEETRHLAGRLGAVLRSGDVVALIGELGTGKTCFVEGACRALGYAGRVRSPSFALLNIYRARCFVYHFDLYRWNPQGGDLELDEWEELMTSGGISFVEWADRLGARLLPEALTLRLAHAGGNHRHLALSAPGARRPELAQAWRTPAEEDARE